MDSKLWLIFLLSTVLMVVQSVAFNGLNGAHFNGFSGAHFTGLNGGHFNKEMYGDENLMESWSGRRQLESRQVYMSYSALFADNTPCQKRGQSYFNCKTGAQANPPPPKSTKSDSAQVNSPKSDSAQANSPKSDSAQADSPTSDPPQADSPISDPPQADSPISDDLPQDDIPESD